MRNRALFDRAKKFYRFLTPKVVVLAVARAFNGACLFVAEVALGFCLLIFFERLQGAQKTSLKWMPFLDDLSFQTFLFLFCSIVLAKGALEWFEGFLGVWSEQTYRFIQRRRMTQYIFKTRELNQAEYFDLLNQQLDRSATAWANVQSMARQCTLAIPLLVTLFLMAPLLTIPLILVLLAFAIPFRVTNRLVRNASREYFSVLAKLNIRLTMTAKNLLLFRIHGMEEAERKNVNSYLEGLLRLALRYGFIAGTTNTYTYVVGTVLIVVIGFVGRKVSPEAIPLILPYLYILNRMLGQTLGFLSTLPQFYYNYTSLDVVSRWWAEHAHDGVRGRQMYVSNPSSQFGKIREPLGWQVQNVTFRFTEKHEPLFQNLSLDIAPGKVTVFVGESGSGKSSLMNLLLGEIDPDEGKIFINHGAVKVELRECRHEVLPSVGYVGAESFLIPGTLRENLLYGVAGEVSEQDLLDATTRAQCKFIYETAEGLNRTLNDQGVGLSAGQKQRLCLARALLRNPKVLILDEATSNLDEATEAALVDTLLTLKGQMTMICASHRKGFLRLADQIVELKKPALLRVAKVAFA